MNNRLTKKYYVPGLISAIIIPLLFWHNGSQRIDSKVYTVIDFGLPEKPKSKTANVIPGSIFEPYRRWDYRKIIVKPHTATQNKALYVSEVKNLQQRNEKETGIEFVIGDQILIRTIPAQALSEYERRKDDLMHNDFFGFLIAGFY